MPRLVLPLLTMLFWAAARDADACSCIQQSPCQVYGGADAVFVGEIAAVESGPREKVARIRLTHVYKGAAKTGETVAVRMGPGSSASCSLDVAVGQRWVMFAGTANGGFSTGFCHGSYRLRDTDALPTLPLTAGEVTGRLIRWTRGDKPPDGLGDVPVWVQTPTGRIASRTAADGSFALSRVPPGKWTVSFDLGPTETADQPIELGADDCESVIASPRPSGGIRGSVVDAQGRPLKGVYIYAADPADTTGRSERMSETDADGAFSLSALKPGSYLIVAGLRDAPSARFPYPPTYHPSTRDRAAAQVVRVGPEPVRLPPLAMGAPLPLVPVSAEIVCRDGTRPASAFVTATRLGHTQSLAPKDYSSDTPDRGRYVVQVLQGHRYAIEGQVSILARFSDGTQGHTIQRTASLEIDSAQPPGVLRLLSDLDRCDRPGGILSDRP